MRNSPIDTYAPTSYALTTNTTDVVTTMDENEEPTNEGCTNNHQYKRCTPMEKCRKGAVAKKKTTMSMFARMRLIR